MSPEAMSPEQAALKLDWGSITPLALANRIIHNYVYYVGDDWINAGWAEIEADLKAWQKAQRDAAVKQFVEQLDPENNKGRCGFCGVKTDET